MFYWKNHVFIPYPHPLPQVCFLDHSFPSLPINCCSTNGCTSAKINKNPEISNHPSTKNSKFISRFHPFRGKDSIIPFIWEIKQTLQETGRLILSLRDFRIIWEHLQMCKNELWSTLGGMVNITHTSCRCLSKIFAYQFKLSLQHTHTDKQV